MQISSLKFAERFNEVKEETVLTFIGCLLHIKYNKITIIPEKILLETCCTQRVVLRKIEKFSIVVLKKQSDSRNHPV